jgi:hypothetical protein
MSTPPVRPIRALLPDVLKRVEQRHRTLFTIQRSWGRLVGKRLAAHTRPLSLLRGGLVVAVDHPGDGFMLSYQRPRLLERLQAAVPGKVQEIIIRPADGVPH